MDDSTVEPQPENGNLHEETKVLDEEYESDTSELALGNRELEGWEEMDSDSDASEINDTNADDCDPEEDSNYGDDIYG
jgi:hypothetical protein